MADCRNCQTVNPDGARFCFNCGQAFDEAAAPQASEGPRQTYTPKHLLEAGLSGRSALEGSRKQVTVMFVDIKGSSAVAASLDAERWHDVLDGYFGILTEAVHRFEGTVNQYTGDGIMALFGAPIAHEDHALRAGLAAIDLRNALRQYFDQLRASDGINLSARVGMNSGEVVVGSIGDDLRMDYTAQGHTVNLAARVEQLCEPGEIFLAESTAQQLSGYAQLRDLGPMRIRGIDEPVAVHALISVDSRQTRLALSEARGLSVMVGRDRELAQLQAMFDGIAKADCKTGKRLAICADAGIGKSRLCEEFLRRNSAPDVRIVRATGVPFHSALPLFPVAGLFRSLFNADEREPAEQLRQRIAGDLVLRDATLRETLPAVFDLLGIARSDDQRRELSPELRQRHLVNALLGGLSAEQDMPPQRFVICIDDVHWMDERSERLICELAMRCCELPGLLLVNHRPGLQADWLDEVESIELQPLGEADMLRLAADWLGDGEAEQALAQLLAERAAGNPYFIEESLHSLIDSGQLSGQRGTLRLQAPVDELSLPDTVQAIIAARIDTLDEAAAAALHHAAVIGRHFNADELAQLLQIEREQLDSSLQPLLRGRFIAAEALCEHHDGQDFEFIHPITQEVAYTSQLGGPRRAIHQRMGLLLDAQLDANDWSDERSAQAAYHFVQAKDWPKAVHWSLRAAVWANGHDMSDSLNRYRQLIALLQDEGIEDEFVDAAVAARAGVLRAASLIPVPPDEIEQRYAEARTLVDAGGSIGIRAELRVAVSAGRLFNGDADSARNEILGAVGLVRNLGAGDLVGRFRVPILLSFYASGHLQEGLDLADSVDPTWTQGPPTEENFASRAFRAIMLAIMGDLAVADREMRDALDVAARRGVAVSWIHANLVETAAFSGNIGDAMNEAVQAVREAEEFASPFFMAVAYRSLAQAHSLHGDFSSALDILQTHRKLVAAGNAGHQFEGAHLAQLANAQIGCGDVDAALITAREAVTSASSGGMRIWELRAQLALGRALRRAGQLDDAIAACSRASLLTSQTGALSHAPFVMLEQTRLAHLRGDKQAVAGGLAQALKGLKAMGAEAIAGQVERYVASPTAGVMRPFPV